MWLLCRTESTIEYLRRDRLYTHVQRAASRPRRTSLGNFGPWAESASAQSSGKYSELELHGIKTAFALTESLWVDLSLGTTQVQISLNFPLRDHSMCDVFRNVI